MIRRAIMSAVLLGVSLAALAAFKKTVVLKVHFETPKGTSYRTDLKPSEKKTVEVDGVKYTIKASTEAALRDARDPGATVEPKAGKVQVTVHERMTIDERK